MSDPRLDIEEYDEAGNLVATYVQSISKRSEKQAERVDVVLSRNPKSIWNKCLDVFLPAGFPQSVTDDYLEYQIYVRARVCCDDKLLNIVAGLFAGIFELNRWYVELESCTGRQVVLFNHFLRLWDNQSSPRIKYHADIHFEGVGVGDASASPTAALLLSVLQESAGRVATILFADRLGTSLEPECKMYRLAADYLNDTALILDCLSPAFPKPIRVLVLSFSSILRALCGVAAGSSKASLSAHFAKGNVGELNAKDSSQETVISLMGMLVGSVLVSRISTPFATWTAMLVLLTIHLSMNTLAVRAVSMRSLNRQRANIVFSHLLESDKVLSPQHVSRRERIFERDGVLRGLHNQINGYCRIGVGVGQLMKAMSKGARTTSGSATLHGNELARLVELYNSEAYILWFDWEVSTAYILLKQGVTAQSQLKAWSQGLLLAQRAADNLGDKGSGESQFAALAASLDQTSKRFGENTERLRAAGWDLDVCALETRSGTRLVCK